MEQNPFAAPDAQVTFADNPEPRCASLLILDTSGSMAGEPLRLLEEGMATYKDELCADVLARKRVEVAVVTFGGSVNVAQTFVTAESFYPPPLTASGDTPMARAVITGLDVLAERKQEYRSNGIGQYRPWVFLITDGGPTDANTPDWPEAIRRIQEGEGRKSFSFFAVGVEGANMEMLAQLTQREPLKLKGMRFRDLFAWLSASQQTVSRSTVDETVPLQNPAAPEGWATV